MINFARTALAALLFAPAQDGASDWPMWRYDAGRTAVSPDSLPGTLHLQWTRVLPELTPAYRNARLQFDSGYEPVVAGGTLFFGSSFDDSVTALDAATGDLKWRFITDGPVRFAPVAWKGKVYAGSDDGRVYCLDAADGSLRWKLRAVPSRRKLLGNGRLISVWPVRGGPVIADGTLYFAAGVWPFEGTFVYAVDAETGKPRWVNDRTGSIYGQHPHNATAFGGVTPQGYLVVNGDDLIVPCGSAEPATFDRHTGKLKEFALPKAGRYPGGWFAAIDKEGGKDVRRGKVTLDRSINLDRHEGGPNKGSGTPGVRSTIRAGSRTFKFEEGYPGVKGPIHTMLVAGGRLFVVTKKGWLSCFGSSPPPNPGPGLRLDAVHPLAKPAAGDSNDLADFTGWKKGYAFLWGLGNGRLLEGLLSRTEVTVIAIDPDREKVNDARNRMRSVGLYGRRVAIHAGNPPAYGLPPYIASLIICEDPAAYGIDGGGEPLRRLFSSLRPFGGAACLAIPAEGHKAFEKRVAQAKLANARVRRAGRWTLLVREGALPGTTDYTGKFEFSRDEAVRAPLGVLWFDDTLGHFKRSPQPRFVDGIMVSQPKNWKVEHKAPFKLLPAVYSDVYTGRVIEPDDPLVAGKKFPLLDPGIEQPYQYRKEKWNGRFSTPAPTVGRRINPMTGETEPRKLPKSYGCDGGTDYGYIYSMRSGTGGFYDKRIESGTINISGPRSGCTNSIIPANGILNVPYFYEGCTCSYPLPCGLALVSMPATHEQWATWGEASPKAIRRIGLNFGAPGDRMTDAGTLWLDVPSAGGPSPELDLETEPDEPVPFYRHSVWIKGGRGWPWVAASGVKGLSSITIRDLKKASRFTVRLTFADVEQTAEGDRAFDVSLQGRKVLPEFDVVKEAGGRMRSVVREFRGVASDGELKVELTARKGTTILSGIEIVSEGLPLDVIPKLEDRREDPE